MRSACIAVALVWVSVSAASAASGQPPQSPELKAVDGRQICPVPSAPVSKYLLARTIIDAYKVPSGFVDWNDTGTTGQADYTRAVTQHLCKDIGTGDQNPSHAAKCQVLGDDGKPKLSFGQPQPTADADNQARMVTQVEDLIEASAGKSHGFPLTIGKLKLLVEWHRDATALDANQQPSLLDNGDPSLAAQVFSDNQYTITCAPKSDQSASSPPAPPAGSDRSPGGPAAAKTLLSSDRIRIRSKADDLWVSRDLDAFTSLQSATFGVVTDAVASKNTFDAHVAVGYALPSWQVGSGATYLDSIPYFQYDRSYVDGGGAPKNPTDVNNIAVGSQERLVFRVADDFYSSITAQPVYIHSLRSDTDIAKLHLVYDPIPLVPLFAAPLPLGSSGFSATAYARSVLNISHVTHSGTDLTLANSTNFVQGGVQVGGALFDKDESSMLNGISIPIDYTYLRGFSGAFTSVRQFTAAINYTLPKTKYVTVGISYSNGRNLDTFEAQQVYKVSLGLKY